MHTYAHMHTHPSLFAPFATLERKGAGVGDPPSQACGGGGFGGGVGCGSEAKKASTAAGSAAAARHRAGSRESKKGCRSAHSDRPGRHVSAATHAGRHPVHSPPGGGAPPPPPPLSQRWRSCLGVADARSGHSKKPVGWPLSLPFVAAPVGAGGRIAWPGHRRRTRGT